MHNSKLTPHGLSLHTHVNPSLSPHQKGFCLFVVFIVETENHTFSQCTWVTAEEGVERV